MPEAADLPDDVEALKAELVAARALVIEQKIQLEKLRFEIACLKRMKYGRSSEQLDTQIAQMQLTLEDLEATLAETPEALRPAPKEAAVKRSEEHTSELQSRLHLVCRLLLEKKKRHLAA